MMPMAMRSELTNRAEGRAGSANTRSAAAIPSSFSRAGNLRGRTAVKVALCLCDKLLHVSVIHSPTGLRCQGRLGAQVRAAPKTWCTRQDSNLPPNATRSAWGVRLCLSVLPARLDFHFSFSAKLWSTCGEG
jgi:hypothetical protein